ncbi:hypothetical protein D0T87_01320 [Bacteroides sp. 51]|nr:HAMP domain-containing sensor histidine kinase [Bacteroides sp. 51]NDV80617.1 hypothetical protein [Bacteroides sp. 51]
MLRKIVFICIIFQFTTTSTFAKKVDSISVDSMHAYQAKYFNNPTDPIVLTASDTLLQMAISLNDTAVAKHALGAKLDYYYYGQGENRTDSVISGVNRLKNFAKKVKNPELYYWAWAARLINHYIKQGEYNIALIEAEKMLGEAQKETEKACLAECYYALGNIYSAKGLQKKALEFMLKEIKYFEKNNIKRLNISFQYSDAAKIYIEQGEKEKAPELLEKALKYATSPYHKVTAKLVYVDLYLAENNQEAAWQELEECKQMYLTEPALKRHIHYYYEVETSYYWKTGNYNKALNILEEREAELKKKNDFSTLAGLNKTKADLLWDMNRKDEAAELYREYIAEQKKEKERNEEVTTGEFATMLNLQQLNAEKIELERISREKQLQNTQIISLSLAGILCIVAFSLYQQRRLNRKLKKSRDELDKKNHILVQAEEELRKAKEIAEQSSWMKTVFIQNMSHEIRTPLNSIVGFSAVLADLFAENEEIKQYASLIEDNSNLLLKLISDILDISALDNDIEIKRSPIDVNSCCQTALERVKPLFTDAVKLEFKSTCNALTINSNYERIAQVLENLMNNSSKFTNEGSVILSYEVKEKERQLLFTITDTGIGIPVDQQDHVFERFVKLDDFSQGTGLGLPICRIIAEKLGGYLIVDKEYTKGTRLLFCVAM